MNPRHKIFSRTFLTLAAAMLVLTSWGLQLPRATVSSMPYPQYRAFALAAGQTALPRRQWRKLSPVQVRDQESRAKLGLGLRLGDALREPKTLDKADARAVDAAWGRDSAELLELLRESAD